ncbi:TP901 family phage tail tape measure protein [Paenibacillus sp. V4I3]|uniref:phage tail tape measure protein n=1 Tax=Paenibacillus sp. V4I3 TaxID=3042305 RepID=UPI00278AAD0C|nr:phage tail tape measure protein [Paenibacillus sp. V4I3]MDQ0876761.1 TP901 family phage tail tape measure protein [Paenibacillus sp. V4I3]
MGVISNLMFAVGFKISDRALRDTDRQVDSLSEGVIEFGIAGAAAMAGFGGAAVHAASEYETAMSKVQMSTGASKEQMQETRDLAKDLYSQNYGENWQDLGSTISTVQQFTKQTGEELKQTTKDAILLRSAFGYEITDSVKVADTMMKNFGISSDESFSLFSQGAQQGLDKSGELLDTANEYSPQFKSLGFSANEMFDTFSAGLEGGAFNLDKIGDAVKEFNIRSKDGSKASSDAYKMLGLDAEKMMSTFAAGGPEAKKSFTQIMQMIADIEDPVAKNTIGVSLMGSQFEDLEATVISSLGSTKSQFDMTKKSLDEVDQISFSSPGQAFQAFGRQIETFLLIPFGEKLLPYFTRFGQWMTTHQPQIEAVGAVLGNTLGGAITVVATSVSFLTDKFEYIAPALAGFAAVIGYSLIPAFIAWSSGMWLAAVAGWAAVAPWLPFIAIGLGVAAVIVGIVYAFKHWGEISNWLVEKWNLFKGWVVRIFQSIGDFFSTYWPYALALLAGPLAPFVMLIIAYWDQIKSYTVGVFTSIGEFFSTKWNEIISFFSGINLYDVGKNIILGLINGFFDMKGFLLDKVKDIGSTITGGIKDFLGIHSPSRVMMEVGFFTGKGLADGITGTESMVSKASSGLADGVTDPHQSISSLAPARASGQSSAGLSASGQQRIELAFTIDVNGNGTSSGGSLLGRDITDQIKSIVQDVIESAARRMGVDAVGTN